MNRQAIQLLSRAIVRLMNRDRAEFERLVELSEVVHEQDRHLYVAINEILSAKGSEYHEA